MRRVAVLCALAHVGWISAPRAAVAQQREVSEQTPVENFEAIASRAGEGSSIVAPLAAFAASAQAVRDSLVALARAQVGKRYVFGGQTPARGFDCSGLIRYISSRLALELPRTAAQQAAIGKPLPRDTARLLPGDLLTFGTGTRVSHVGIYVGDGRFIHASSVAGRVVESRLARTHGTPWRGARRIGVGE